MSVLPFPPRLNTPTQDVLPVELDGNRVLVRGRHYRTFCSVSNAARVASALMTLEALGLLDTVRMPEPPPFDPQAEVRRMLKDSVAAIPEPPLDAA